MTNEQNFKKELTPEDINNEIEKIKDFFEQIPDELKSTAAERLIYEIVNWASFNHYEALGIFEEAKISFRENSIRILNEEDENV